MKKLTEYYTQRPAMMDFSELTDPELQFDSHREQVNELVLNLVIKYLAKYLNIQSKSIAEVRAKIKSAIDESYEENKRLKPALGSNAENIHGFNQGVDAYPLQCHGDIRKTAAIFKEIAFSDKFREGDVPNEFYGLDFGSGTGVLTLAMAIMARRLGSESVRCIGVEQRELTVKRARNAIKKIVGKDVSFVRSDIFSNGKLEDLLARQPHAWVSETIQSGTPELDLDIRGFGLGGKEKRQQSKMRYSDPFVLLLHATMSKMPDFRRLVESGEIFMFPNVFNELYTPNYNHSMLRLRTGPDERLLLPRAGKEFEEYEDLDVSGNRWGWEE